MSEQPRRATDGTRRRWTGRRLVDALTPRAAPGIRRRPRRARPRQRARRCSNSARRAGRCSPRVPSRKGSSTAAPGRSTSRAGSPRRWPRELIARRRPDRRLGLRAEHVDDPARPPHRAGGDGRCRLTWIPTRSARIGRFDFGVIGEVTADRAGCNRGESAGRARSDTGASGFAKRSSSEIRWRDVDYDDTSTADRIDPRTLTIALDDMLPAERVIGVDSGNFMGYPSMFLSVPDEYGFCFTQAFQSIGLGLATAIGAALAQPDRLAVAALGDGGALMSVAELDTVRRLGLPMIVVVYNDDAYGAEVHHFGPDGVDLSHGALPAHRHRRDRTRLRLRCRQRHAPWTISPLSRRGSTAPRERPLLIDAKVTADRASWWLEEAFRGH